jgi:ABC-type polysaccharide transport system, permease component
MNLQVEKREMTGGKVTLLKQYLKNKDLFVMLIPVLLYYICFCYIPMGGIVIAFKDYKLMKGIGGSPWVGVDNFIELFTTPSFYEILGNTLWISILRLLFGFPAPILLALLLNEVRSARYKKTVQTISYLPHFLSWVILTGVFQQLLSPSTGAVNALLGKFGIEPIYFLGSPKWFVFTIIFTGVWQSAGWGTVIYLAAIAGIDPQMYEAAMLDGAGRMKRILYITLPSLAPTITITLILSTGNILNAGFDQIMNMYNEAVYEVGDIIDTYVYRRGLEGMQYSYSTAVNLFKNVIGLGFVLITNKIAQKLGDSSLW